MRVIRNRVVREWAGNDTKTPPQPDPPQSIGKTLLGREEYAMPKFSAILPTPETSGDFDEMWPRGRAESAALTDSIMTAQDVVKSMAKQAKQILELSRPAAASRNAI